MPKKTKTKAALYRVLSNCITVPHTNINQMAVYQGETHPPEVFGSEERFLSLLEKGAIEPVEEEETDGKESE